MVHSLNEIYTVLQSVPSSGSGRGISYWKVAAECGRKAHLMEQYRDRVSAEDAEDAEQADKPIGRIVGTHFHALQQFWRQDRLPAELALGADETDIHFREAVRAMRAYRKLWPVDYFGTVLGCEVLFPRNPAEAAILRETFGDDFTFRADLLVEMDAATVAKIELERGVSLNGPGRYLVDYKCLWQIQEKDVWEYQFGPQSIAYPLGYNLLHPDAPVQGMIFDVMSRQPQKESTFALKHFQLFVAQWMNEDIDVVRNAIDEGRKNLARNKPNPNACVGKWGPCPFLRLGICDRRK